MKRILCFFLMLLLLLLMVACSPETIIQTVVVTEVVTEFVEVEREVVVTEVVEIVQELVVTEVVEVKVEIPVTVGAQTVVEFWTTDNEEVQISAYEAVAERYMATHPDVDIRIVPIEESGVIQRINTARTANRLPDIVRMGIEHVPGLAGEGVLDEIAAETVINDLGVGEFRTSLLGLVTNPVSGAYSAVPFDGWLQGIWYRTDIFNDLGLAAPTTWSAINAACDALPGTGNLLYGLTLATDPGQNYSHTMFEQIAISNNAWPFDLDGNVTMNTPQMVQALEFYTDLQRCATPGEQYWRGARENYETDKSGMLFYSTYILDDLVDGSGLEGGGNVNITVDNLALKTGYSSNLQGPNGAAVYGQLMTLAIMQGANPAAQDVVKYFLTDGYLDILVLAPFEKVPVTRSAVNGWRDLSPYFDNYSDETLNQIASGFDSLQRWLFRPNYDLTERTIIREIEGQLLIPQAINNIAIQGTMTPESAAVWLQEEVVKLVEEQE
jgi:multiple sugar transport system substrate-binding protein